MESTLQLEIVTPDKVVVSQTVDYVGVPGIEGEFGVLPHHIALHVRHPCQQKRHGGLPFSQRQKPQHETGQAFSLLWLSG